MLQSLERSARVGKEHGDVECGGEVMGIAVREAADDGGFDQIVGEEQAGVAVGGDADAEALAGLEALVALQPQQHTAGGGIHAFRALAGRIVGAPEFDRAIETDAAESSSVGVGDGSRAEQVYGRRMHKRHISTIGRAGPKTPAAVSAGLPDFARALLLDGPIGVTRGRVQHAYPSRKERQKISPRHHAPALIVTKGSRTRHHA